MILSVKNRFVCICLLLGLTLPATGQVYMTSKAKVHSVSTSGVGNDSWVDKSFYSTSSHISAGPSYSVSVPSISVKTSFSTSAAKISGGVSIADGTSTNVSDLFGGPNKLGSFGGGTIGGGEGTGQWEPPKPGSAPIGDIPWVVMVLAAAVFVIVKKRKFE